MDKKIRVVYEELDQEWVNLMFAAREIGLTPEEIRQFLQRTSPSTGTQKNNRSKNTVYVGRP